MAKRIVINDEILQWIKDTSPFTYLAIKRAGESALIELEYVQPINMATIWNGYRCQNYNVYVNNNRVATWLIPDSMVNYDHDNP